MTGPIPYLTFPGTARQALAFYQHVFGGAVTVYTLADFGRDDGPADAIAHGILHGTVNLFAADAVSDEPVVHVRGVSFSLLGTADPATLGGWFTGLCDGGTEIDPLQKRPWGAHDGQVTDRHGVRWLIGYED